MKAFFYLGNTDSHCLKGRLPCAWVFFPLGALRLLLKMNFQHTKEKKKAEGKQGLYKISGVLVVCFNLSACLLLGTPASGAGLFLLFPK